MKKGDLVKLKETESWDQADAETMGFKSVSEIPEFFEVEDLVIGLVYCCIPVLSVKAVGIVPGMRMDLFEVALPAGEPDLIKLMEEAKQMELMSIGF